MPCQFRIHPRAQTSAMSIPDDDLDALPSPPEPELSELSARMLNEFVYCPRLFYYEYVDGIFVHNADTLGGARVHRRVDSGTGKLPPASATAEAPSPAEGSDTPRPADESEAAQQAAAEQAARERGEIIHSRSVWLSSTRLNLNAKLDLVESREASTADGRRSAVPVDYKKGAPREGEDSNEIWDADRMQLGVQMLILRDNGYECTEGVIYYQATRQRVQLPWTQELADWVEGTAARARSCAASRAIPPPLRHSPKCVRCSLAGVCLPDETILLTEPAPPDGQPSTGEDFGREPRAAGFLDDGRAGRPRPPAPLPPVPIRPLLAARDDRRALYLNTPGLWVGVKSERLVVRDKDKEAEEVRLRDVSHLALFGNIQLSTQAVQQLCELEIPVTYFSMGGWFYGLTHGHGLKNVGNRIEQFRCAGDPAASLASGQAVRPRQDSQPAHAADAQPRGIARRGAPAAQAGGERRVPRRVRPRNCWAWKGRPPACISRISAG